MNRTLKQTAVFFALLSLALAVSTAIFAEKSREYGRRLSNNDQQAVSELISQLSQMDGALDKLRFAATSRGVQTTAAKLWQCAETAKSCMSSLSLPDGALDKTQKFVGQTGDFAYYLLNASAGGEDISAEHRAALDSLQAASNDVTTEMNAVAMRLRSGQLSFDRRRDGAAAGSLPLSDGLSGVEQEFPEYATLIYDGPFSEHLTYSEPRLLEGLPQVGLEQAIKAGSAFAELPVTSLSLLYDCAGRIPSRCLTDGKGVTVEVSDQGGIVFGYKNSRYVSEATISASEAVRLGAEFLRSRGFGKMKESYYTVQDRTITVNYAYTENDITVYGDLIKVTVALDDGEIVGMEARGYLMSHTDRTLPRPVISEQQGRSLLDGRLTVRSSGLALVPTSGENEVLCREYVCDSSDGTHVIVYINAQTGQEQNILILIEDENGTLTI